MNHSYSKGFTLIELMIAIGIFSVFLIILAGVFSRFIEVERHGIAQGSLILDVQSAMESFIKEARTGYGSTYRTENGKQVAFRNQAGVCVSYRLSEVIEGTKKRGIFERAQALGNTSGECSGASFGGAQFTVLTSNTTNISSLFFDTTPSAYNPTTFALQNQGVITLSITATPTKADIPPIVIQNTVTSRQTRAYAK